MIKFVTLFYSNVCCVLFCIFPARWAHFQAAAREYAAKHNGENYFSVLNKVSRSCHLKAEEFVHDCSLINTTNPKSIKWVYIPWKLSLRIVFDRDDNLYPEV